MNAIGQVTIETARAFVFDNYARNRATGSFILIDPATNATVAAGMISGAAESSAIEPLAGISWRMENGALILASEEGFTASRKECRAVADRRSRSARSLAAPAAALADSPLQYRTAANRIGRFKP